MKITSAVSAALSMAFNSKIVRSMSVDEYRDYTQQLLMLSIESNRAIHDAKFVADFVSASLANPPQFKISMVDPH